MRCCNRRWDSPEARSFRVDDDPSSDSQTKNWQPHKRRCNDRVPGVGRNTIRGPGFATADVRLTRDIPLYKERVVLRLIGEAFNVTNRANFNNIVNTQYTFSGGFYRPTTNFLFASTTFDPRILQLAAKITF